MFLGDSHNFGSAVELQQTTEGPRYRKPRPVFWEYLFFGASSPLKLLLIHSTGSLPLRNFFEKSFSLVHYEYQRPTGGFVEPVHVRPIENLSVESLYNFGALCAYAFVFGLFDLHRENVIPQQDYLQVIDVELVLADLVLPDQTLLLPFADVALENTALSQMPSLKDVPGEDLAPLFQGFNAMFQTAIDQAGPVTRLLASEVEAFPEMPVRVIIRKTRDYVQILKSDSLPKDLHPAERTQLARGDIPYFFKFVGGTDAYYYTDPNLSYEPVKFEGLPLKLSQTIAKRPQEVLMTERLSRKAFPSGILLIARKLIPEAWTGDLLLAKDVKLSASLESLYLQSPMGKFASKRFRTVSR